MMKNTTLKNALLGIALALVATYMFPIVLVTLAEWPRGFLILFSAAPLYVLLYTFWLVIPLGVALGMLIPQIARGKNRWMAALEGAGLGAVGGLAAVFCFTSVHSLWRITGMLWISVILYSALWVGGYAFYRAKGQSLYR
jgi:phosphotransferase system  glucose/maltose/N-acetylglucosamine-specific IIC component